MRACNSVFSCVHMLSKTWRAMSIATIRKLYLARCLSYFLRRLPPVLSPQHLKKQLSRLYLREASSADYLDSSSGTTVAVCAMRVVVFGCRCCCGWMLPMRSRKRQLQPLPWHCCNPSLAALPRFPLKTKTPLLAQPQAFQPQPIRVLNLPLLLQSKYQLELPYHSRYLLIAGYLASYNPSRTDSRFFAKVSAPMVPYPALFLFAHAYTRGSSRYRTAILQPS